MLLEFIKAMLSVGVITALASFVLFCWSLRSEQQHASDKTAEGSVGNNGNRHWAIVEQVQQSRLYRAQSALLHKHWVEYGGGFYGLIAVLTLLWVEGHEIIDFLGDFDSLAEFFSSDIISSLISLMVNAIMNAVMAFAWPAYWLAEINSSHVWLWFVAAWLGYLGGKRLAESQYGHTETSD